MKRLIYFAVIALAAVLAGCSKADQLLYSDVNRLQLNDTTTINTTFVYDPVTTTKDTVYIKVNTIGQISDHDREVKMAQFVEPDVQNTAVAGVHYLSMDDPSLKKLMVVKANAVSAMIPVVLLRDASLKQSSYRLRLQLVGNDQFGLGEVQRRSCAIVFSDRLERFYSWRVDASQAGAYLTFGKYSVRKHQFMIDILKEQIDEAWYQAAVAAGALQHYKNYLKDKLNVFNADPANVASGKSPMRETDDPNSPLVSFP